jgi:cell division transport system permease protein
VTEKTTEADAAYPSTRRDIALVPPDAVAGRTLVTVIAIMTFLAAMTAGTAVLISETSSGWRRDVAREMTIQIKPSPSRNIEADLAKAEEIARDGTSIKNVTVLTKSESERLLEPWLGSGLDLPELPIPRLLVLKVDDKKPLNIESLRRKITEAIPGASLDDHRFWIDRLSAMSWMVVIVSIVILTLVLIALALAVAFATRGAMAGSHEVIHILHFVGAADSYIAHEFQKHFLRLGLEGGLLGGGSAILVFLLAGLASTKVSTAGGDQIQALFGSFDLGLMGYAGILLISASVASLTSFTSRSVVLRQLQGLS